ncbi:MAG: GNAT family N-acetyltransferase [Pseudomonadota bacterium]
MAGERMTEAPALTTERLLLRPHTHRDFEDVYALWSDPKVVQHISGKPSSRQESWSRLLRYAGHWTLLGYGYWVVQDRGTARFLGEVGLANYRREIEPSFGENPEAGWVMAPHAHGRGIAREAVAAVLAWADAHLTADHAVCMIAPENAASRRLAATVGFREVGTARYQGEEVVVGERQLGP